ncbi:MULTISPECIES: D-alanyl-D-alanine carboxypeptidase [unclassified Mesorhizobium]|uniref:D-alanyl-D-alanine carboxypeptidase n=1 Tax=unclassified Mesorhizobium TaxID=325217 RepID=UPI000FCB2234|nr:MULTISPECIES: D-alanyl-D-alanine carboxypeptidase [unclassified Mesorhizobium]TIT79211.1 MAG: D-alanyl-D-alanine carboxypeptidase [Mesorhizobium sp.]TGP26634.1 D-alanyl-D-alanine carboxypeptidase [Mesorhizobium sp. M1D.F.Ca.ET.231.01.1.1]TGP38591.1 D-alanyl-D-alanine carboxypeptidase [Mesorhizobium sp. M1D.F.Ca.ET.234.01.1.1]TGS50800.1 D-alanyl-D-alanine carboxypeptidase [Mesorhizobium sp. M1D.F.Ca.ET.184.01.1.1]TGS66686.1 D-alanyl-D-alanine carboxypeptidase [Mesorhizobium sp. M1D.F.Ca.ET.1
MRQALSGFVSKSSFSFKAVMVAALAVTIVAADVASALAAKSAAIVVDAKTGKVLYSADANGRRYPASLTKMMTLYLTFEALAKGRISRNTPVPYSVHAASEPPTKLGVRAGGSVPVETAILSMVTKSANDSATALGEMLGGSEDNFARMMTAKARQLGMNGTVFRNANGLPDPGQFTTAHDMAMLGIALREHFPQYYGYFSQRSFLYGRQRINGHNRLLGRIKGVDGIKTGYTRASGYNLVSSVADGDRRLVAVVMGGASGRSRDNQMASLISTYLPRASTRGGGNLIAKAGGDNPIKALAKVLLPKHDAPTPDEKPAVDDTEVASADDNVPVAEETKPVIQVRKVKTVAVAAMAPGPQENTSQAETTSQTVAAYAEPAPAAAPTVDPVKTSSLPSGWVVQVASSPTQSGAQALLDKTSKQAPRVLADAEGFTVAFDNGGVTYYRARFGGFGSKDAAWKACDALKRKKISCYAVQQ